MSALRQRLRRPGTYLAILCIVAGLAVMDSYRSPANQISGYLYVSGVRFYQSIGRPLLKGHIQCRYSPTCSVYSIEAVQEYGIRRGLVLTIARVKSCTKSVPPGTHDPLPRRSQD